MQYLERQDLSGKAVDTDNLGWEPYCIEALPGCYEHSKAADSGHRDTMATTMRRSRVPMEALEFARSNRGRFLKELQGFLRIPSISTKPEHAADIEQAAAWLCSKLQHAGFPRAKVMATQGHPIVYAEWLAAGDRAPTVLIYGHYDVQPPDPLELWQTPPFEPTVIGDDIFARGASDDKGQLFIHVKAIESYGGTVGALPVNVKCIFEGEEESGSPSLETFIAAHAGMLSSDVAVISDTHFLSEEVPSIVYALRGMAYVEVSVTGPESDLHSGTYGGAVHNPIHALCAMIAKLHDQQGRIAIPGFYDKVRALSQAERTELARIPFEHDAWLREAGVKADWGEETYTIIERTSARPTLDVNGIWGGYIEPGAKTVLPSKAFAKISMRLVPEQDPDEIAGLIQEYLHRSAPPTIDVEVQAFPGSEAAIVGRDGQAMTAAREALARAFGSDPVLIRAGGSIPVVTALQKLLGIETILMGFGLPDDRLHAPNEKFHLPNYYRGISAVIHFLAELSK